MTRPAIKRVLAASVLGLTLVAGSLVPVTAQVAKPDSKAPPAGAKSAPAPAAAKGPATTPTPPPELEPASGPDAVPADPPDDPADATAKSAGPGAVTPPPKPGLPTILAPEPGPAEADYFAKLDQLVAGVRDFSPSPEDLQRVRDAFSKTGVATLSARETMSQIQDPAARKLVAWAALRSGIGEPQEFLAFIEANPSWPDRTELIRRAEEQLLTAGGSASKIRDFFKGREPATGPGWAALASAHLAEKNEATAKAMAAKVWREFELPSLLESGFLERFGALLTEADHKRRLDRILVDQVRFSAERNQRADLARRVIALLSEPERAKGEARLAIFLRAKLAGQMLAALPAEPEGGTDWGLAYQKVQHLRRTDKDEDAWAILTAAPTDPELITSPDDWWSERRGAAYDALKAGKAEMAYDLVKAAGPLSVNQLKDQSFMAGWLALRYLGKPELARQHLEVSSKASDGPLSKARADYWLGRALEALGQKAEARDRYAAAAMQADTFHGQLARHKLEPGETLALPIALPALPSAADAQRFAARDSVRAAVIAVKSGISRSVSRALFAGLRNHLDSEAELAMLAHLASALGDPQASLRVGKTALARGKNLMTYAYPLHVFPAFIALRDPPELPILLGIARQETEFNNVIVSTAGARGLLQVMPVTAKHVCRDHKVVCNIPRLISDNSYNAMIAAAYIGDRMAEFRGNYVLTLAGYNAGPGRARQWMREFGDPRETTIDALDWIERIPIEETREYVKKVLSNIQVYRARLGDPAPLRLMRDLTNAKPARAEATPAARN